MRHRTADYPGTDSGQIPARTLDFVLQLTDPQVVERPHDTGRTGHVGQPGLERGFQEWLQSPTVNVVETEDETRMWRTLLDIPWEFFRSKPGAGTREKGRWKGFASHPTDRTGA